MKGKGIVGRKEEEKSLFFFSFPPTNPLFPLALPGPKSESSLSIPGQGRVESAGLY